MLDEEVFMSQPQAFIHPLFPNHVFKLQKSIYGLKEAPRQWFKCLTNSLTSLGFIGSKTDSSLYFLNQGSVQISYLLYVDDILITGNDSTIVHSIIKSLQASFALKDLGVLNYFLGIEATWHNNGLLLSQSKYIQE